MRARGVWAQSLLLALCSLVLMPSGAGAQVPEILRRAPIDPSVGVNFHALATPDTVWVGQQVHYQVGVFMDEDVRSRLRRNPEFMPPELRAMLAYDLPTYQSYVPRPGSSGERLETYVFRRALFPLQAGRYEIPSATLAYSLPLSRSFFSREESFTRRTRPVVVHVRALPEANQPADFDGAVGRLRVQTVVDTIPPRVGDPLLVTVKVRGEGNVNLLPRPRLTVPWGTVTPSRERVEVDAGGAVIRGVKEFDWLVTPRDDGIHEVPAIRYPYFDPVDSSYQVSTTAPVQVEVLPGTMAVAAAGDEADAPPMAIRTTWRGALPPEPAQRDLFWWLALAAPIPALGILAARTRTRRTKPAPTPQQSLRSLVASLPGRGVSDTPQDSPVSLARRVRHLTLQTISERLGVPHVSVARPGDLMWLLGRVGVSAQTATECELVLKELDELAYSAAGEATTLRQAHDLSRRAAAVTAAVDAEASRRPLAQRALRSRGALVALVLSASLALSTQLGAEEEDTAAAFFQSGVVAYTDGDVQSAQSAFRSSARLQPRAADAWANFGTASWTAGDTASAVVGWQRALRLEPRAEELRTRLSQVPGASVSSYSRVPAVPAAPVQWMALAAWLLLAATVTVALMRRSRVSQPLVASMLLVSALSTAGALWLHFRTDASDLAVVVAAQNTLSAPALLAEPGLSVVPGEIVRVERRQGVWTRVRMDRGAGGWLEDSQLIRLAD